MVAVLIMAAGYKARVRFRQDIQPSFRDAAKPQTRNPEIVGSRFRESRWRAPRNHTVCQITGLHGAGTSR